MKKLWITGADGFLAQRAAAYYADRYMVTPLNHGALDITDADAVLQLFTQGRPDYVLHCAAVSDTGYSQQHPATSEAINLYGTEHVAKACAACGAKLVYMSSDQVYNGCRVQGPLPENIALAPQNVYGRHKLAAECAVAALLPGAVGLRLSWMYDLPDSRYRLNGNLLVNLHRAAETGTPIRAAVREHRGISNVWAVIARLEDCFALPGGIYNFGSGNRHNSYETFLYAARQMMLPNPEVLVLADAVRFPEFPRNLAMDGTKLAAAGITFPDTWQGIAEALHAKSSENH